jgi:Tfp pilus assembly protein PilF
LRRSKKTLNPDWEEKPMTRPNLNFRALGVTLITILTFNLFGCGAPQTQETNGVHEPNKQAEYHYKLATGLIYEKKPIAALKELETSLKLDPLFAKSHYLKGFIHMGRRNNAEALTHFRKSVELDPRLFEANNALAATLMALKRWDDALVVLEKLLADPLNPTPWLAHNNAGWSHHKQGNPIRAIHHLEMSVFHNPKFCLGYYNLGLVLKSRNRLNLARLQFEQAQKKCPRHAPILLALGDLYERMDRVSDARQVYADCQKLADGSLLGERCRTREVGLR